MTTETTIYLQLQQVTDYLPLFIDDLVDVQTELIYNAPGFSSAKIDRLITPHRMSHRVYRVLRVCQYRQRQLLIDQHEGEPRPRIITSECKASLGDVVRVVSVTAL